MNCSREVVLDELTNFANRNLDEFHDGSPKNDLPAMPNVKAFKYEEMKDRTFETISRFDIVPFTIQRLCELVGDLRKHYNCTVKFMRTMEEDAPVVNTIEQRSVAQAKASAPPAVIGVQGAGDDAVSGRFADTTQNRLAWWIASIGTARERASLLMRGQCTNGNIPYSNGTPRRPFLLLSMTREALVHTWSSRFSQRSGCHPCRECSLGRRLPRPSRSARVVGQGILRGAPTASEAPSMPCRVKCCGGDDVSVKYLNCLSPTNSFQFLCILCNLYTFEYMPQLRSYPVVFLRNP